MGLDYHIIFIDVDEKHIELAFKVYMWLYKDNEEIKEFLEWLYQDIIDRLRTAKRVSSEDTYIIPSIITWFKYNYPDELQEYMFDLLSTIMLFEDYNSMIIFKFEDGDKTIIYYFIKGKYFDNRGNVYKVDKKKLKEVLLHYKIEKLNERTKKYRELLNKLKKKS